MKTITRKISIILSVSLCLVFALTSCVTKSGEPITGPTQGVTIQILKGTASISGETTQQEQAQQVTPFTNRKDPSTTDTSSKKSDPLYKNAGMQLRKPIPSFIMNEGDTMSLDVYWGYAMTLTVTSIESDVTFTATYKSATKTYTVSKTNMMGQTVYFNNLK